MVGWEPEFLGLETGIGGSSARGHHHPAAGCGQHTRNRLNQRQQNLTDHRLQEATDTTAILRRIPTAARSVHFQSSDRPESQAQISPTSAARRERPGRPDRNRRSRRQSVSADHEPEHSQTGQVPDGLQHSHGPRLSDTSGPNATFRRIPVAACPLLNSLLCKSGQCYHFPIIVSSGSLSLSTTFPTTINAKLHFSR